MQHKVKIFSIVPLTHDVKRFIIEKPPGFSFHAGQATEVSINKPGWEDKKRPFSFTSLADAPELEFTIKIYEEHKGVTSQLNTVVPGDELLIDDAWGAIEYKGPGYFIAGGAGITPFIAILRQLKKENNLEGNKLFFSNKTEDDIILRDELDAMLGKNVVHAITDVATQKFYHGFINEEFLKSNVDDFSKHFYVCGPPKMVKALTATLVKLGAKPDAVVFEK